MYNRIEWFKQQYSYIYEFEKHPDDEFWIVTDVDDNWSELRISEWNEALQKCSENNYRYVISVIPPATAKKPVLIVPTNAE